MTRLTEELREDKPQVISEVREENNSRSTEREKNQRRRKNLVTCGACESTEKNGRQRENEDIDFCKILFEE